MHFPTESDSVSEPPYKRPRGRPAGQEMSVLATPFHEQHFAFIRAVAEGGHPLRAAWQQHLSTEGGPDDERHFKLRLGELVGQLRFVAGERGLQRSAEIALAGIDLPPRSPARALLGKASAPPAVHGSAPTITATQDHRLEHLDGLILELKKPPTLGSRLSIWIARELAQRLAGTEVSGRPEPLVTVSDLINFVNRFGQRWWKHVPRLGESRAQRLMTWLTPLAAVLGHPVKESSLAVHSVRESPHIDTGANKSFGIVPLDRLAVPSDLDGRVGVFRSIGENTLGVQTDLDAIFVWLRRYKGKPRSCEKYSCMLERFYLWCLLIKKKPLGSLVAADLHDYLAFLKAPPDDWVNVRQVERNSSDWRPLRGPLSENSQRQNFYAIHAFLAALHKSRYLGAQVAAYVMPTLQLATPRLQIDHSFDDAQWAWLMACWARRYAAVGPAGTAGGDPQLLIPDEQHPDQSPLKAALLRRQRLVLELGSTTGLRLGEMTSTRRDAITCELMNGKEVWLVKVTSTGGRERQVAIEANLVTLIDQHHLDMRNAGTNPDTSPTRGAGDHNPRPGSHPDLDQQQTPSESRPAGKQMRRDPIGTSMWPLIGVLRQTSRKRIDADRYGSLHPTTLDQALRRFLSACADEAKQAATEIDSAKLRRASTHWLRHFFTNSAMRDNVPVTALMETLGYNSLDPLSPYVRLDRAQLVRAMRKLRRR